MSSGLEELTRFKITRLVAGVTWYQPDGELGCLLAPKVYLKAFSVAEACEIEMRFEDPVCMKIHSHGFPFRLYIRSA